MFAVIGAVLNFTVFESRDGLLFELENGKPKLILLSGGKSEKKKRKSASLCVKCLEIDLNMAGR